MIKVLIVEDSKVIADYIEFILNSDPEIQVIGKVTNGKRAISFIQKTKPDIITMDIDMPVMDGLVATRIIMETNATPILIVTASRNARETKVTMEALAAGALTVVEKPVGIGNQYEIEKRDKLISMIKIMQSVKVVSRKKNKEGVPKKTLGIDKKKLALNNFRNKKIVGIGISSGGPQVLKKIFSRITGQFPYPIVVVQHISEGFLDGLVTWFRLQSMIPVHIAEDMETVLPGHIYFAPDNHQLEINNLRARLVKTEKKPGLLCPSVAHLFKNLAKNNGSSTIAMLLTGMGSDGAKELKTLREAGTITIAQDKKSSLVHGMPGEAIKLGAAEYIMNTDEITDLLFDIEKDHVRNGQ